MGDKANCATILLEKTNNDCYFCGEFSSLPVRHYAAPKPSKRKRYGLMWVRAVRPDMCYSSTEVHGVRRTCQFQPCGMTSI